MFGIASVVGPILGGAFTDRKFSAVNPSLTNKSPGVSWRWCFYINLPIGAFTILSIVLFLHIKPPPPEQLSLAQQFLRMDPIGTLIFVPSIVCLVLALQWGGSEYPWSSGKIVGLFVTCGVLFVAFWALQAAKPATATVPMRIATQRSVLGGVVFLFLLNGSLFAIVYFLPIWFEAVKAETAI